MQRASGLSVSVQASRPQALPSAWLRRKEWMTVRESVWNSVPTSCKNTLQEHLNFQALGGTTTPLYLKERRTSPTGSLLAPNKEGARSREPIRSLYARWAFYHLCRIVVAKKADVANQRGPKSACVWRQAGGWSQVGILAGLAVVLEGVPSRVSSWGLGVWVVTRG